MFCVCHQKRHETGKYFPISQTTFYWWLSNALKIRFLLIWWAHEDKWAVETSRIDSTARTIERRASKKDYTYRNQSQTHETTAECEEGDIVSTEVAIDGSIYGAESKMNRNNNTHMKLQEGSVSLSKKGRWWWSQFATVECMFSMRYKLQRNKLSSHVVPLCYALTRKEWMSVNL